MRTDLANVLLSREGHPDETFIVQPGARTLTRGQWRDRTLRLVAVLARHGVKEGDVVAILAPNVSEYLEAYIACAVGSSILAPLNHRLSASEIAGLLDHSEAKMLILHPDFGVTASEAIARTRAGRLSSVLWLGAPSADLPFESFDYDALLDQVSPSSPREPDERGDAPAQLYYTSGTTGRPKGVILTHGNVLRHARSAQNEFGLNSKDIWLHAAPLFHLADAWAVFAVTLAGGRHVCLPYFHADEALNIIESEAVTITNLVPTMLNLMVNDPQISRRDLSSLRTILSGGAPISPETVRLIIERFGCDYVQTYGMTETSPFLTVSLLSDGHRRLSLERQLAIKSRTGRPFEGVELRVVRPDGSEVDRNDQEVGEIIVRGPTVTPGYWKDTRATREALNRDGWLSTGDLAVVDRDGSVNIVDRKKDTIISGGENIYSTEVEFVLYEHPAILEAAVIGVPHAKWGEAVKAIVALRAGAKSPTEREIIDFVKSRIARYKAPKTVEFVEYLPKTGSGKISKQLLRQKYLKMDSTR